MEIAKKIGGGQDLGEFGGKKQRREIKVEKNSARDEGHKTKRKLREERGFSGHRNVKGYWIRKGKENLPMGGSARVNASGVFAGHAR